MLQGMLSVIGYRSSTSSVVLVPGYRSVHREVVDFRLVFTLKPFDLPLRIIHQKSSIKNCHPSRTVNPEPFIKNCHLKVTYQESSIPESSIESSCLPDRVRRVGLAAQIDHGPWIVRILSKLDQILKAVHRGITGTVASLLSLKYLIPS